MDTEGQITYWCIGSDEDWDVAVELLKAKKIRHALFFLHLAMEKMLKAHVCRATGEQPPRIHDLVRLANRAGLDLPEAWLLLLGRMNAFCLMGRYPGNPTTQNISPDIAHRYLREAQEVRTWLQQKLSTP